MGKALLSDTYEFVLNNLVTPPNNLSTPILSDTYEFVLARHSDIGTAHT